MHNPKTLTAEWVERAALGSMCLVIATAYQKDKRSIDGTVFAALAKRLIAAEMKPGGPYTDERGEPDFLTNLSIAYLFWCLGKPLPKLDDFIAPLASREHSMEAKELLGKYYAVRSAQLEPPSQQTKDDRAFSRAKVEISRLPEPLRTQALAFLEQLQKSRAYQEIIGLPLLFKKSLLSPPSSMSTTSLSEANIYTWIAYTIYDHIIDSESNSVGQLPVANAAHRLAMRRYQTLFGSKHPFQTLLIETFDGLDTANAWELANCRFEMIGSMMKVSHIPAFKDARVLAQRSFAHALGALALAYKAGLNDKALEFLKQGFDHYIIARQLGDDIHDWRADMQAGQASAVIEVILREAGVEPGEYNLEELIARMQNQFWHTSMDTVNQRIHKHLRLSRELLLKSNEIQSDGPIFSLLNRLETSATESTKEYQRYKNFASAFAREAKSGPVELGAAEVEEH